MRKTLKTKPTLRPTYCVIGIDTSMSSIAGAAVLFDGLLDKMNGPALHSVRWNNGEHYFQRMEEAAKAQNFIHSLMSELGFCQNIEDVYIAIEEPWPMGMVKRMQSAYIKQQAQMHGAFLGGLLRYGYQNIFEVNSQRWKSTVASEMDMKLNKEFNKWSVKQWAMDSWGAPDLPDLIQGKNGKMPRPESSRAKAIQPDDRYDALGILSWMLDLVQEQILV